MRKGEEDAMDNDCQIDKLIDSKALLLDPRELFDQAIIGVIDSVHGSRVVAYDAGKCITALMSANGWDEDEASDWFEYNARTAYMGEGTPVFIDVVCVACRSMKRHSCACNT
jgi:hypothetical protein